MAMYSIIGLNYLFPVSNERAVESSKEIQRNFQNCKPLPGAEKLLLNLSRARNTVSGERIELALTSSTKSYTYGVKTGREEIKNLLNYFQPEKHILGDDSQIQKGRGKLFPDIYFLALNVLNEGMGPKKTPIMPNECCVFEDSVIGVEAGRRAGMRVVWVPHPDLREVYEGMEDVVLAGRTGGDEGEGGEIGDGCGECIASLENFEYEKYGIEVPV